MTEPGEIKTHQLLDRASCGKPIELVPGHARLVLETSEAMRADAKGLVHGGFVFSLADHAAMLAINHPNVVLGSAATRFHRPVHVGDRLEAEAKVERQEGAKSIVAVEVTRGEESIMTGELICFTPQRHVLESS